MILVLISCTCISNVVLATASLLLPVIGISIITWRGKDAAKSVRRLSCTCCWYLCIEPRAIDQAVVAQQVMVSRSLVQIPARESDVQGDVMTSASTWLIES